MRDDSKAMQADELTGNEFKALRAAILKAYPTPEKLTEMVRFRLNKNLHAFTSGPLEQRVFELIRAAEAEGWTRRLIEGARAENQGNAALKHFETTFRASVQRSVSKGTLERIVSASGEFVDIVSWREKLERIEMQVCRIETGTTPLGTGFLVGDATVLTNYHVIEGRDISGLSVRFDHKVLSDGTTISSGRVYKVVPPVLDQSPYSSVDFCYPTANTPTTGELDYALLRIDGSAGTEVVSGNARGYIRPSTGEVPSRGIVFIVQHPNGRPMQVTFNEVLSLNANLTRITYKADTEPGSSGSPIFDRRWNLIAVHHGGDPRLRQAAEFNEGIPVDTIRRHLNPSIKDLLGWT